MIPILSGAPILLHLDIHNHDASLALDRQLALVVGRSGDGSKVIYTHRPNIIQRVTGAQQGDPSLIKMPAVALVLLPLGLAVAALGFPLGRHSHHPWPSAAEERAGTCTGPAE